VDNLIVQGLNWASDNSLGMKMAISPLFIVHDFAVLSTSIISVFGSFLIQAWLAKLRQASFS